MQFRSRFSVFISVLFLLALALPQPGCAPKMPPEPEWEKQAREVLDQAEALYSGKQYDQAATLADAFLVRYPGSRHRDRAYHLLGNTRIQKRDYRQALSYFTEIIERFPASPYIPDAKFKIGKCYFELKEYDLAVPNLEDRSRIEDPAKLLMISEMLSHAYTVRADYPLALREYVFLAGSAQNAKQRAGYRERVRQIVDTRLTGEQLADLASGTSWPADLARLRLAAFLIQERRYREAARVSESFLDQFPAHPERTRGEMLLNEATARQAEPRYLVGALLPRTGQLAFFGDRVLKGAELAVHTYNSENPDNRVELVVQDTAGLPDKAVSALSELASKRVVAGIGPITTREEEAMAPVLENLQIPIVRPAASRSGFMARTNWIFRNALTIDSQARKAAQYALGSNLERFVILYPDEPYGKDLSQLFIQELEQRAEIVAAVAYPPDTKDFGPYIRKIMGIDMRARKIEIPEDEDERKQLFADYSPGFDALYMPGYAERVGLLIPQLAFYNITGVAMIGSDNWHSRALIERAGRYAEGAVFVDGFFAESSDPMIKNFVDSYRSAYQEDPDILSAQGYDAAMMIFSQLKERRETPSDVREGLLLMQDWTGITGPATFSGSGEAQKKLFLIKIENGRFSPVNSEE